MNARLARLKGWVHSQTSNASQPSAVTSVHHVKAPPGFPSRHKTVPSSASDYWFAACAVLATKDPWIHFDPHYLTEIVPVLPPSPDLLLSGDVEPNPGPLSGYTRDQEVLEYTLDDLESIYAWQQEKIIERREDAHSSMC
jgi:hypothetical protein